MNAEIIGSWVGTVWAALESAKVLEIKELRKVTKLKEKEIYVVIGWLAREGKVNVEIVDKDINISLIY